MPRGVGKRRTIEEYEKALRATAGLRAAAAKKLGLNRSAVTHRIKKSRRLQKVIEEVEETTIDMAEGVVFKHIQEQNFDAAKFYLKTKGKKRGYIEQEAPTIDMQPRPMIFVDAETVMMSGGDNGGDPRKAKPLTMKEALKLSEGNSGERTGDGTEISQTTTEDASD